MYVCVYVSFLSSSQITLALSSMASLKEEMSCINNAPEITNHRLYITLVEVQIVHTFVELI